MKRRSNKSYGWIINQYASTPTTGMGGRHFYLARELVKKGCQVDIVTASFSHILIKPHKLRWLLKKEMVDGINYCWLRVLKYRKANSKLRIINWLLFSIWILLLPLIKRKRPDWIIYSSPSLLGGVPAYFIAKVLKAKFIFEVRDLWPETLIALGGYSSKSKVIRLMYQIEAFLYRRSDKIISNLQYSIDYIENRTLAKNKFHWIPNGISLNEVINSKPLSFGVYTLIPKEKFIIGYVGTIGRANALEFLIYAAEKVSQYTSIHFVIIGNGTNKYLLEELIGRYNLSNVTVIESIPKEQVQTALKYFSVLYVGWRNESLYQYGISPNKLPEYLYSSIPILHSFSGKGDLVSLANAGLTVPAEDIKAIAKAIISFWQMPIEKRKLLGKNGRDFVINNFLYNDISNKLLLLLDQNGGGRALILA